MDEKLALLYDSFVAGGTKMSASKEDFIAKVKTDKSYASIVAQNLQSVGQSLDDYTGGNHARDWNEENAEMIKSEQKRQAQKPVAEKVPQKEGVIGGLINKTYNEAKQKPIDATVRFDEEQIGLNPPKKVEKTPKINWGETQYLESTKPLSLAPDNQLNLVNKAIAHTNEYGEDIWQGNTQIAKEINQSRYPLQEKASKGELSEAQVVLLNKVGKDNPQSQLFLDVATKGDEKEIKQLAINNDDEYAKNLYNETDKAALAKLGGIDPKDVTPEYRLNYWYEKTKGLGKMDMPETIPYQLIANDSKNLQEQLKTISNLFQEQTGEKPETTEEAVASIPTGFGAEFKTPSEKLYAYYQVLGNRFQELTREFQKGYEGTPQQDVINLKDRQEQMKSLAGTILPFVGIEDLKDPKYVEYIRVLNKINALAPLIQKGKVGQVYGELGEEALVGDTESKRLQSTTNEIGKFAASMWGGVSDMLGYDVLKKNQEVIAQQQQQALAETGGKITPQQQKVLDERMSMEGFFNPKSWGQAGSSLVGMGVIMSSNPFAGEFQAGAKGLQMLNKSSKLFNSEQKLTRLGKIVQGAVGITAAGLETEIAGQVSGEDEKVTDELSFGMGAIGEAGKMAFGGLLGIIGKGVTKVTPNALVAQVEKQYGKLSPKARKSIENVATNVSNRVSSGLAKEVPEEIAQTAYENYKKYGLDGMMQQTITDIMGENPNWNEATRWVAQIALMGALDGQPDIDRYKLQTWATTMAEKFSGQKVDADLLNEFSEQLKKETENAPMGVKFKDNGVDFTLNNTKFNYNSETGELNHEGVISTDEATKAKAAAETLSNGYNAAVKEGDFTPLFGQDAQIANKQNEETPIPQSQEVPAQEIVQETPEIAAQEAPIVESAEAIQEAPEVEAAEIEQPPQKTAEELDARRTEISTTLSSNAERANELRAEIETINETLDPLSDDHDEMIDLLSEKENELSIIQGESESLVAEDNDIAEQRKVVRTEKEAFDDRVAEIDYRVKQNKDNLDALSAQHSEMMRNGDRDGAKAISAEMKALKSENEALGKEKEGMQPKKESAEKVGKISESEDKRRKKIIVNHLVDSDGNVDEAFEKAGYVNHNGIWVAPEALEYAKKVSKEAWQHMKDKGIKFFEGGDDSRGVQKGVSYAGKTIRGVGVNERVGDTHVGHDHTVLHETAHHVWQEELTPEQKAVFSDNNPVSDYAKSVKEGNEKTMGEYDEEDFAELYARNKGDVNKAIEEKKSQKKSEKPIIAEMPQLETPIVESKKQEPEPTQKEAVVEKLPEVGGVEESGAESKRGKEKITKEFEEKKAELEKNKINALKALGVQKKQTTDNTKKEDFTKFISPSGVEYSRFNSDDKAFFGLNEKDKTVHFLLGEKEAVQNMLSAPDIYLFPFYKISGKGILSKADYFTEMKPPKIEKRGGRWVVLEKGEIAYGSSNESDSEKTKKQIEDKYNTDLKGITDDYNNKINELGEKIEQNEAKKVEKAAEKTPKPENKQPEKVAETPVAPAAPKEQKPQPEKGESKRKPKTEPPKPPATQKEPTTIKPVQSGSELAEMLGNTEQAIETGKVWDRVAKMWAKKTGKTAEDWWNRIESIQVGGEGQKGSVKFENGKFIVFLASDRDISTPVHELAHIFQTDLSESEKKSVVAWYNKGNKTNHKVADWGFAENETSRNISEYFAEGFVEWLKEGGKTTDKAMQSVFDKFAKWLKDVVNTVFDAKVELNDDMRAIYEQIFTEGEKKAIEAEVIKPQNKKVEKTASELKEKTKELLPYYKGVEQEKGKRVYVLYEYSDGKDTYQVVQFGHWLTEAFVNPIGTNFNNQRSYELRKNGETIEKSSEAISIINQFESKIKEKDKTANRIESKSNDNFEKAFGLQLFLLSDNFANEIARDMFLKSKRIKLSEISEKDAEKLNKEFDKYRQDNSSQILAEAYHTAKQNGTNPELVKAVEGLLGEKKAIETKSKNKQIENKFDDSETTDFAKNAKFKSAKDNSYTYFNVGDKQIRITKNNKTGAGKAYFVTLHEQDDEISYIYKREYISSDRVETLADAKKKAGEYYYNEIRKDVSYEPIVEEKWGDYSKTPTDELKRIRDKSSDFNVMEAITKELNSRKEAAGLKDTIIGKETDLLGDKKEVFMKELPKPKTKEELISEQSDRIKEVKEELYQIIQDGIKIGDIESEGKDNYISKTEAGKKILIQVEERNKLIVPASVRNMETSRQFDESKIAEHRNKIAEALQKGKYQTAIQEGRMTAQDAVEIIKSAGLEVPSDITNNTLYQTDPYHKSLEDWIISEVTADELAQDPKEARDFVFEYIEPYVGKDVANEIIDRAFERILTPKTESEILESELEVASKEKKATAEELIEMDDFRTKVLADLPPNATQEQFAEAKATIEAKLEKSNLSEGEKKFILSKIKERQFGAKFRDTYSQEMSKELQERVLGKTYFYNALSNDAAKTQAEIRLKGYYDTAIEEVSQKWYESGKLTDENAKQVMTDPAFLQDVMQATVNEALRNLDNIANIENYWEKVAATNYAIKAAGELEKSLRESGKKSAANSIVDLVEMAVEKLARTGTALGRAVNMFGLYANMGANIAKTILMKQINDFNANLSDKQKALKETIESTVNDINNIVQDMANGKDSELLTRIMDAVAKNPKVEELLNEIMNRWESLDNEGQYKTILSEAYWAQREIDALNKEIAKLKSQADIDAVTITTLENKVIEKQKKIANLNTQIRKLKDEKGITERAERQAKTEAEKAVIVKAAKVKATKTTTDAAFSRLRGYKNENTNTNFQRRVSGMAGNYNAKTIKDVNRFIETLVDEYYEVNTQHTIDGNYVADFNSYALAELATKQANPNLAIDPTLYRDITTTITAGQFDQSVRDYTQDRIDGDYKNNMKKRVVGVMKDPAKALQPKTQKAEIRLALGELIMQAATAQTTEKQNIQQLIEDTFGITGANVNALATEFDKQFNEQVLAKQMQIAGKRMLTAQEQSKKTDEEIGKEYVKQLEKKGEKAFLENLAKDLRLSQGIGWSQDILDRMSNKYQMNIHSQAQKNELNRLFDIAEKAPEGTPKQKAMHDVMLQVIRMSYYGNLRKWEMTKHAIRHSNKLSGLSTQLSNIIDSVYKLVDLYVFKTILRTDYSGSHKVRVAAVTKALKGAAWKSAWNKFNLQEARLQGDFENIAEFFATNFAELPLELRGIKNKESVGVLKFLNLIAEAVIQPLYTGKFKGDNSHSVATLIRGVMNFWDNVATESLKAGEQAVLLSQIDPTLNISNEMDIDMADTKQFNSGFTIGQIMADEIADKWYAAGSREAFERKQELLSQYLQEKYGTEEVADDYARAETYKKPPSGFIGMAFRKVNEVVRDANRANIERIQEYENKRRNATNKGVNKDLAWYKFASMGTEMVNMFDYMRTQLNVLNMVMDRSIWLNAPRLLLNKSFGDTFSKANVDTYKKQFESIHDKEGKKLQTSSVEFVNIGSQIYEINKAETVVDDKIKAHQEDARLKKKKSADKATSEIAKINNQKTLATVTKQRKIADINRVKAQEDTNTDKMLANAIAPLNTQKQVMAIQRKALVAGYVQAQTRIKDRLFHSALVNMIGATIAFLIAGGDDEDEETLFDLVGDTQLKDVGSVQAMKNVNEAKAVKRFIFRYGQLTGNVPNLGIKNTSQTSFAWGDTPYVFDFSIWASIADAIKRVKYGKEEAITPSNAIDVVSQATLATLWQMGGQVGTQNLAEAADPKANLAWWERFMKVLGSSITFQVPAILRHTISDVVYGGQAYARNKDASDMNYLVANYFRMHGLHPRFGANYMAELAGAEQPFIEQYSPVDGKPVLVWTNRDRLEVYRGIRGVYDMAKGNETKLRSINQSGYKTEDVQDYLVFKGWLAKTGAATKISISNPQNIMPEYKDDKLAYLRPIPEKDFQEKIVKVAGTDIGISMKAMYDRDRYLTKIPTPSEGSISDAIKEDISSNGGLSRQELIEAVKSGEFDTKSEIYSYLAKSDEMAYKIGVQVIAKKVAKAERDKAIIEYLQERPDFAKQGESVKDIKERLEEK